MAIRLYSYQKDAVDRMKNGCILCGGVGSGKSRTSLAYYYLQQGLSIDNPTGVKLAVPPQDLYIITTARKRDTCEWEGELTPFLMSTHLDVNHLKNKVVVDSWNNIKKYQEVKGAFFIFDEDRVTGSGSWVKSFLKITKSNVWILLSATPGDTWMDYVPVFIANGFYKNRTDFSRQHVVYSRYSKYPKVDRYIDTGKLNRLRRDILVDMDYEKPTVSHHLDCYVEYDRMLYKDTMKYRTNPETNEPIVNITELCYILRKISNSDESRLQAVKDILDRCNKAILFYNYDYELDLLKLYFANTDIAIAEWNGHEHQSIPTTKRWLYLVNYMAGSEGWNCITTDTVIFYSQSYSYKTMVQAAGRIDRLNTPYKDLYFYHLKTRSPIDLGISRALSCKKKFNEEKFIRGT